MIAKGKSQQQPLPALFACAARVSVPQLGAEDAEMRQHLRMPPPNRLPFRPLPVDDSPVNNKYLKKISSDLVFDESVVKERCFHMMPYDSKYLAEALDPRDILPSRPRVALIGRHNARGPDRRHMPCGLKRTKPPSLKPMKKKLAERALEMSAAAVQDRMSSTEGEGVGSSQSVTSISQSEKTDKKAPDVFLTEVGEETEQKPKPPETLRNLQEKLKEVRAAMASEQAEENQQERRKKKEKDWDAYLMAQLSQLTATWIVHQQMPPSQQQKELKKMLTGWYGTPRYTDLVQEEGSETEDDLIPQEKETTEKPKKKWKKKEAILLEKVFEGSPPEGAAKATDPYSDDNQAPFYRQPAGIRRQRKTFEKEEADGSERKDWKELISAGAINATAHAIKVKSIKEPKPPTLRDFMPEGVGSTLLDTENQYQQELLTGVKHVYRPVDDRTTIVMESDHKYKKVLQPDYPEMPEKWCPPAKEEMVQASPRKPVQWEVKSQRWRGLPEPYDDTFEAQKVVPPGFDVEMHRPVDPAAKKQVKQNHTLMQILHDWRASWSLSCQFTDATYDDIIRDMTDMQPHVRLKAIATVGKAAEYRPPAEAGIQLGSLESLADEWDVPDQVFVALECLLDDSNAEVQRAAAVTLYALDHPCEKAEAVLRKALKAVSPQERWTAAQCLAHYGICDSHVVAEIINQIMNSEEPVKHEQGISLLGKVSNSTTLVHSMVGEQLNSSSWRHRVIACKILPALYGSINKDLTHKLTDLMWRDWHKEVRQAAAQCLGKTSHGRDVHDDIRRSIMYGSERIKLEAISRLGQLGIMTAKLLPAFLKCFDDEFVSIRSECCITCSNLCIQEEQIVKKLVHLATFDPIWKVKALAIQALGRIGVVNQEVRECLLWAMRYEEKAGVRAEACHSLASLDILDEDILECMQERLLVESSEVVRDEILEALQSVGLNASEDLDTVARIKMEVRKLCHHSMIATQIVLNENDALRRENLENMIYLTEEETKATQAEQQEAPLKRLRAMTLSGQSTSQVTPGARPESVVSGMSTTPVSREGTLFTPSADKELEAILNRAEDAASEPSSKSRPVTGDTEETSGTYTSPEMSPGSKPSMPEEYIQEVDRQLQSASQQDQYNTLSPRPPSTQLSAARYGPKRVFEENVNPFTPGRSRLALSPSTSIADLNTKGSQISLPLSGRRTVVSRDTLQEREKVDQQASTTYQGLSARYADMVSELMTIDKGLNAGSQPDSAESKMSKFLTVPGEFGSSMSQMPSTPSQKDTGSIPEEENGENKSSPGEAPSEEAEGEAESVEQDGQVAVTLDVPTSGDQKDTSAEQVSREEKTHEIRYSDEDKVTDDDQSTHYSTDYPSLAEDVAPSYIDDSICGNDVAPSTYGESTTYQTGQASDYEQSGPSDIDNESTLD